MDKLKTIKAGDLNVAYFETGELNGTPIFLLHGFPYDINAYKDVVPKLSAEGCRSYSSVSKRFWTNHFY